MQNPLVCVGYWDGAEHTGVYENTNVHFLTEH